MWLVILFSILNFLLVLGSLNCALDPEKSILSHDESKFDIANCGNSELNLGQESERSKLTQLKAFNNSVATINYETFRWAYNLESVDLQTNLIADIPSGTFRDLAKMTKLYLNRNRLSRLNVGAFEGLSSLTHLFLDNNQLKTLDVGTFDPLRVKVWRIRKLWKKIFLTYIFYY